MAPNSKMFWLKLWKKSNTIKTQKKMKILKGAVIMFFKKKSQTEKKELLLKENIKINCTQTSKDEVIKAVGQMLVDTGYVNASYVDGMLEREKTFSTYMGAGLAIPHGVEQAKKEVITSGIAVMTFPNGIVWDDEKAYIIVGIASVGEEHLEILGALSDKIMDEESSKKLIGGDVDTVYNILTNKA